MGVHKELGGSQPVQQIGSGRYFLVREIASGGMGRVWEGRDSQLGRAVAIKELSLDSIAAVDHAEFLERAVQEGRNAAALSDHPNIVTIYDVVVEGGSPWTVMQFVRGRSLGELLKAGPPPVEVVASMAGQMLSAIRHVHNAGIVHRDIKPHNIMINESDGRALLTDFGISKNSRDSSLTQTGYIIGSMPYMAPERQLGKPSNPASDLFSLGVTLFEALEGYKPFGGDSETGTVTGVLSSPLPQMRRGGRLIPLVYALTEKDPRSRPTAEQAIGLLNGASVNPGPAPFHQDLITAGAAPIASVGTALNSGVFVPGDTFRGPGAGRRNNNKGLLVAGSVAAVVLAGIIGGAYTYSSHASAAGSTGGTSPTGVASSTNGISTTGGPSTGSSSSSDNSTTGSTTGGGLGGTDPGCQAAMSDVDSGSQGLSSAVGNPSDAINALKAIGTKLDTDSTKSTNPAAAAAIKKVGDDYIAMGNAAGSGSQPDINAIQADATAMGSVCGG
ncbi:serine/threonine protein kinase [Catenulispora sp. NF23]|uniref:serine/threonine-protein kinase n=1 Tax=Catenulispora pinistramenti TaxID=2705254 RepID=UPI001BAC3EC0|nr:serine/threonine-protein kinase [Catenulispora pinistramenti]MBS2539167.1 serine/threonine protein kinase [Catenulispora pinistramenti]